VDVFSCPPEGLLARSVKIAAYDASDRYQVTGANEFFSRKVDSQLLFGEEAISRHADRDHEHAAQNKKLRAGTQILEHGLPIRPIGQPIR
jgi:hypothetical protein